MAISTNPRSRPRCPVLARAAGRCRLWGGSGAAGAGRLFPGKKRGGGATDWESLLTFAVFPRGGGGDVRGGAGLYMFT